MATIPSEYKKVVLRGGGNVTPLVPWVNVATTETAGIARADNKTIFLWDDGTLSLNPQPAKMPDLGDFVNHDDELDTGKYLYCGAIVLRNDLFQPGKTINSISIMMSSICNTNPSAHTYPVENVYLSVAGLNADEGIYLGDCMVGSIDYFTPDHSDLTRYVKNHLAVSTNTQTPVASQASTWLFDNLVIPEDCRCLILHYCYDTALCDRLPICTPADYPDGRIIISTIIAMFPAIISIDVASEDMIEGDDSAIPDILFSNLLDIYKTYVTGGTGYESNLSGCWYTTKDFYLNPQALIDSGLDGYTGYGTGYDEEYPRAITTKVKITYKD